MHRFFGLLVILTFIAGGCSKSSTSAPDPSGRRVGQGQRRRAAQPPAPSAATVDFATFTTDRGTASDEDFAKKYPAGKAFTMKTKVQSAGECGDSDCRITLGNDPKVFEIYYEAADQKQLRALKPGMDATVTCTPVYDKGSFQAEKSCTVAK